ncbi:hypothetical protein [Streptomyces malaysiensis]|uniref:hypothetical protein n=1 Tax=Streptomyces malaysiensis TaxID=92644 RepID=UPI00142F194E|nr:hypothetical protein [Streptomyces malaysiensis]
MVLPLEQASEATETVVIAEDLRRTTSGIATLLEDALRQHGYAVPARSGPRCTIHAAAPLCCETADRLMAGLNALRTGGSKG